MSRDCSKLDKLYWNVMLKNKYNQLMNWPKRKNGVNVNGKT